jgi:hypothetical protein
LQRPFAQQIDQPRHAARKSVEHVDRARAEGRLGAAAGDREAVHDIRGALITSERQQAGFRGDTLVQSAQSKGAWFAWRLLPDQDQVQQLFPVVFERGQ